MKTENECKNNYCFYNLWIDCTGKCQCDKCGWNPDVAKRRIEELRKKYMPSNKLRIK